MRESLSSFGLRGRDRFEIVLSIELLVLSRLLCTVL